MNTSDEAIWYRIPNHITWHNDTTLLKNQKGKTGSARRERQRVKWKVWAQYQRDKVMWYQWMDTTMQNGRCWDRISRSVQVSRVYNKVRLNIAKGVASTLNPIWKDSKMSVHLKKARALVWSVVTYGCRENWIMNKVE